MAVALGAAMLGACAAEPVPPGEIVAIGEECSNGSEGVSAQAFDDRGCLESPVRLCADVGLTEVWGCAEEAATGELYRTHYPVLFDRSDAWVPCSGSDEARVMTAPFCAE